MTDLDSPPPADLAASPLEKRRRRRRSGPRFLRRIRRFVGKINWLLFAVVALGIGAVVVVGALVVLTDTTNRVWSSWSGLSRVLANLSSKPGTALTLSDFERLQSSLNDMLGSLDNARARTGLLTPFAPANADLSAGLGALDAATELAQAARNILNGLEPTLFFLAGGASDETVVAQVSSGERLVELLRLGRGRFLSAQQHLDAAGGHIGRLDLAEVSTGLLLVAEDLTTFHRQLSDINSLLTQAPDLLTEGLGLLDTQSYLVLSQNSDELRPSGGYVSTFGWMTVRNARIIDYNYGPSTATSPNPPPAALADQVKVPPWWIQFSTPLYAAWDGSWHAHFPATAEMAAWYYNSGGNPQSPVSGVIAIDLYGFEYILEALGSIPVPSYGEVVTAQNFREAIYRIRAERDGDRAHKQFLAELYRQILANWQTIDHESSADLLGAFLRALQEKHIMLYFADPQLNAAVDTLGWSGAQVPARAHDYLMVADANLGNKSNRSIVRQLTYDVEILPDGVLQSRATVAYDYSALVARNDPAIHPRHYNYIDYHNLLQVFVPAGSALTGASNLIVPPQSVTTDTHTIFVTQTEVEYNSGERFQFSYSTPALVERFGPYRRYRLLVQKQPG